MNFYLTFLKLFLRAVALCCQRVEKLYTIDEREGAQLLRTELFIILLELGPFQCPTIFTKAFFLRDQSIIFF